MKPTITLVFTTLLFGSALFAQSPTWAEQLHKIKTGVWPSGVEQRLKQEKLAREQAQQQRQVLEALSKTDTNADGLISKEEREKASQSSEKTSANPK